MDITFYDCMGEEISRRVSTCYQDDVVSTYQEPCTMAKQEDRCTDCRDLLTRYKEICIQPNAFIVHIDVKIIKDRSQKEDKKKRLNKLGKVASALRNSEGGSILVHLAGHVKGDRYLGYFDDFISGHFTYLIEDGKLYVETYKRFWLDTLSNFADAQDFICIDVNKTNGISTVDFNTKIRNDFENVKPTSLNILSSLVTAAPVVSYPPVYSDKDLKSLQESRNVELKSISKCNLQRTEVSYIVDYIWEKLKLRDNITSMSKNIDGGFFYVGIAEKPDRSRLYESKTSELEGSELFLDQVEYNTCLNGKLKSDILVLNFDGTFADAPDDLIRTSFHEVSGQDKKYILEVAVRRFNGIVFYDKKGPRAYTIDGGTIRRMSPKEWLERVPFEFLVCPLLVV